MKISLKALLWANLVSRPLLFLWWGGIVFVIMGSILPQGSLTAENSALGVDKLARVGLFLFLAFIPAAFFSSGKLGLCVATSMAPLGFILELAQKYFPQRHFSAEDIIANNIGTVMGIGLALCIRFFFYTGGSHRLSFKKPGRPKKPRSGEKK